MQLLLGIPLELVHKGFEVGMVYMAGVLAGRFVYFSSSNWDTHKCVLSVGKLLHFVYIHTQQMVLMCL